MRLSAIWGCAPVLASMLVACLSAPWAHAASLAQGPQTYLGHQVVVGTVLVPVLGDIETRTDTWVLVTLTQQADVMRWVQRTCKVWMAPVAGVKSSLPADTLPKLPVAHIRLDRAADGDWRGAWDTQWTAADLDEDGFPGVSVRIDVPLCAGHVYMAMQTHTQATASWVGASLLGELQVTMRQRMLGASNVCLRLGRKQQQQAFIGVFALTPVADITDCDDISDDAWPTAMQNPRSL